MFSTVQSFEILLQFCHCVNANSLVCQDSRQASGANEVHLLKPEVFMAKTVNRTLI
jgi:hypothetical protein